MLAAAHIKNYLICKIRSIYFYTNELTKMDYIRLISPFVFYLYFFCLSTAIYASDDWLIAAQSEKINTGQKISFEIIKPNSVSTWPEKLQIKCASASVSEVVELTQKPSANNTRRTYTGVPKVKFAGVVRTELIDVPSNRLLMLASEDDFIAPLQLVATTPNNTEPKPADAPKVVLTKPGEEPPITANEPLYFLLGYNQENKVDSRFQISFKYRPFDPEARVAQFVPFASNLYFAYTQTTIWDIGGESSPFKDTSYRPSVYYKWAGKGRGILPDEWKTGFEHESNGQSDKESRSINTVFIRPLWHFDLANGRRLTLLPKIYHYVEKTNNSDIQRYRGFVDWQARFGREDGAIITGLYRQGTGGYSFGQFDFSYPVSDKLFGRTGTFIHLQVLDGYGETLIDYNRPRNAQLRVGLSLAR